MAGGAAPEDGCGGDGLCDEAVAVWRRVPLILAMAIGAIVTAAVRQIG